MGFCNTFVILAVLVTMVTAFTIPHNFLTKESQNYYNDDDGYLGRFRYHLYPRNERFDHLEQDLLYDLRRRELDQLGGANIVKRFLENQGEPSIDDSPIKRQLDPLGGPNLVKRELDQLGGSNILKRNIQRELDLII